MMSCEVLGRFWSHQVVVGFDAKQISEIAEGQWGVRLEAEVGVVVSRGQVASFTGVREMPQRSPEETKTQTTH